PAPRLRQAAARGTVVRHDRVVGHADRARRHRLGVRPHRHLRAACQRRVRRPHPPDRGGHAMTWRARSFLSAGVLGTAALLPAAPAAAQTAPGRGINLNAIGMFLAFVALTLVITYWAARRTRSAADFYAAGGGITGFQNGLAIAGDYMSAASFLGISG